MPKKNIRKIPEAVRRRLPTLVGNEIVAACLRTFSASALRDGQLRHLGISLSNNGLEVPSSVLPPVAQGKFSEYNIDGREIVRKDLPKETHYRSVDVPNWGDYTYGSHTVDLPYERYPRDFVAPRLSEIRIHCRDTEPGRPQYAIAFEVGWVLDRTSPEFETQLFEALNLLQENVGACGVERAGSTIEEYERSLAVTWEILPPGSQDHVIARVFRGREPSDEEREAVADRYKVLMALKPRHLVYGTSGFQRYFGALLEDDLVVFENVRYGNAIYVMYGDWRRLSQRSRTELLSGRFGENFDRIPHTRGWKKQLKLLIKERREDNS
jgi:hypothetical protein